jgi:hypothetical protein
VKVPVQTVEPKSEGADAAAELAGRRPPPLRSLARHGSTTTLARSPQMRTTCCAARVCPLAMVPNTAPANAEGSPRGLEDDKTHRENMGRYTYCRAHRAMLCPGRPGIRLGRCRLDPPRRRSRDSAPQMAQT